MERLPFSRRKLLAGSAASGAALALVNLSPWVAAQGSNAVVAENARAGTTAWRLTNPSSDAGGQLNAYCRQPSGLPGETIQLCVNTNTTQAVSAKVYRMGYYGGNRGREIADLGAVTVAPQPAPSVNSSTGERVCNWAPAWNVTVSNDWLSGIYIVKLQNAAGFQTWATFTVVDPRPAAILHQQSILNYQAYNAWPVQSGKCLYDNLSWGPNTVTGKPQATVVSFDRPYECWGNTAGKTDRNGAGLFFDYEADQVAWMEQNGYDVAYCTNVDVHLDRVNLTNYGTVISAGHDEYWSTTILNRFTAARNAGVDLFFAAANHAYWRVRLNPSGDGRPARQLQCWKEFQGLDPANTEQTTRFRDSGSGHEQALCGAGYANHINYSQSGAGLSGYVPTNTNHWVWAGSGAANGVSLGVNIVGYEIDQYVASGVAQPPGAVTTLSASPFPQGFASFPGSGKTQNTTIYQAPSGAWVFAAGTMAWTWALARSGFTHGAIQKATSNVLAQMLSNWGGAPRTGPPSGGTPPPPGIGFAPFGSAAAFVAQQYRDFLGREADTGGRNYWVNNLAADGSDRARLIGEFLRSAEFGPWYDVARLYQAVFARIPDAEGYQYWVNRYFARTITLQDMAAFFVTSPEWNAKYGPNLTSAQVIDAIYPNLFNRPPDPQGRAYWISRLDAGMPRHDLVLGFAESDEFKLATLAELATIASYQGLLRRVPNQGELNSWASQLESGAQSALGMIEAILRSPEYASRFK